MYMHCYKVHDCTDIPVPELIVTCLHLVDLRDWVAKPLLTPPIYSYSNNQLFHLYRDYSGRGTVIIKLRRIAAGELNK